MVYTHEELLKRYPELKKSHIELNTLIDFFISQLQEKHLDKIVDTINFNIYEKITTIGYCLDWDE